MREECVSLLPVCHDSLAITNLDQNNKKEYGIVMAQFIKLFAYMAHVFGEGCTGLYFQFFALGIANGSIGLVPSMCYNIFHGSGNTCATAVDLITFPGLFKCFLAVMMDLYSPFGKGLKAWMVIGWIGVLSMLLQLALFSNLMSVDVWIVTLMVLNLFLNIATVPLDGLSVQLSQSEPVRGTTITKCVTMRYAGATFVTFLNTVLFNSQATNYPNCPIGIFDCWNWGLHTNGYYFMLFLVLSIVLFPSYWTQTGVHHPHFKNFSTFTVGAVQVLQNCAFTFLAINVVFFNVFFIPNMTYFPFEYQILSFSNVVAGINNILELGCVTLTVLFFRKFLLHYNWRITLYCSISVYLLLGFVWIPAFYDLGGTRNRWFAVFLDWGDACVIGFYDVIMSLVVVEIAIKGLEATTFEVTSTLQLAAFSITSLLGTQLLGLFKAESCNGNDYSDCINVTDVSGYLTSNGPYLYTRYSIILILIGAFALVAFTPFLPSSVAECHARKEWGNNIGWKRARVGATLTLVGCMVIYALVTGALLLNSSTACLKFVGGSGCD